MTRRDLAELIYRCQSLPPGRKDAVLDRLLERAGHASGLATWKHLLGRALAVRENFFVALSPRHKEKILEELARAIRSMTKAGRAEEAAAVLDEIYTPGDGPGLGGEAVAFFRTRLRETPDRKVKAALAAVILELPEAQQTVEDMAAAVHGDYLLLISAMERLCALGNPGMRVLLGCIEEIAVTPAVTYTLLSLVDRASCDETLRAEVAAAVLRTVSRSHQEAGRNSRQPGLDSAVVSLRTSRVVQARRAFGPTFRSPKKRVREEPVFLRLTAARRTKLKGGSHVGQENDTDAAIRRGSPTHPGGPGGERFRLSAKLKRNRVSAEL